MCAAYNNHVCIPLNHSLLVYLLCRVQTSTLSLICTENIFPSVFKLCIWNIFFSCVEISNYFSLWLLVFVFLHQDHFQNLFKIKMLFKVLILR